MSVNGFLNCYSNRVRGRWYWKNSLVASYGLVNTDENGIVKNDDKVDYFSTLGVNIKNSKNTGVGAAFNFRSQFSNGYDRNYLNQGLKRRTSGFFAPAYITIAPIGFEWHPKHFTFYGTLIGIRGIFVSNAPYSFSYQGGTIPANMVNDKNIYAQEKSVAEMYGVNPDRTIRYEVGPYISAAYDKEICKNVTIKSRVDLFSDFGHNAPGNIDVFWINTFSLKVNKWLSAVYGLDIAYDDNVRKFGYYKNYAATQVKTVLGLGVTANFGKENKRMRKEKEHIMAK